MTNYLGKVFNNGKLTVIAIHPEKKNRHTQYIVKCSVCEKDPELFGDGTFVIERGNLKNGVVPCGCGGRIGKWTPEQNIVLARRSIGSRFEYDESQILSGQKKIDCYCSKHDKSWTSQIKDIRSGYTGCKICGGEKAGIVTKELFTNKDAEPRTIEKCKEYGYTFNGFIGGKYEDRNTRLDLTCDKGHPYSPTFLNFVRPTGKGSKCPLCSISRFDPNKSASVYVVHWKADDGREFLKYGITGRDDTKQRIVEQNSKSEKFKPIKKICLLKFDFGMNAVMLEREFDAYRNKIVGNHGYIDKESFPDGYTETLPVSCLNAIKEIVLENTGVNLMR